MKRGDEATGIITGEFLPAGTWGERLHGVLTQCGIAPVPRGIAGGGAN